MGSREVFPPFAGRCLRPLRWELMGVLGCSDTVQGASARVTPAMEAGIADHVWSIEKRWTSAGDQTPVRDGIKLEASAPKAQLVRMRSKAAISQRFMMPIAKVTSNG